MKIEDVAWHAPAGWIAPDWLKDEPEPARLPMSKDRMHWCLHALGWSVMELTRRIHTDPPLVRQMARGRRGIPDALAFWLEAEAARMLAGPALPAGWRPKRQVVPEDLD